jgi:hypothetical protein
MDCSKLSPDSHHSWDPLVDHIFLEESFVSSSVVPNINNNLQELRKHSTSDSSCYHQSYWHSSRTNLVRINTHGSMNRNHQNNRTMILRKKIKEISS